MHRRFRLLAGVCLVVGASIPARADGYKDIARVLSRAAHEAQARRVAVLPFIFLNRPLSVAPVIVSERLTAQLGRRGEVELVERQLIGKLLSEKRLGLTGALDSSTSGRIGKLLNVDAVVSGTLVSLGNARVEINARLINAQDGRILSAVVAQVKEDWQEATAGGAGSGATPRLDLAMISIPQALFAARCAGCHGDDGQGREDAARPDPTVASKDLTRPAIQRKSNHDLGLAIKGGADGMPAFGDLAGATEALSETEVVDLTRLIRRLGRDRSIRDSALKSGGRLFDRHCAACHGFDGRGTHLASGLFDVPIEKLDLAAAGTLDKAQLVHLLRTNKRKMLFKVEASEETMTQLWLYLQKLAKSPF